MSTLVDLGVDNIITDDPETLLPVLKQRAEISPAERILLGVRNLLAQRAGQGRGLCPVFSRHSAGSSPPTVLG